MVLRFVGGIGLFFSFTEVSKEEVRKLTAFPPFFRLKSFVKQFILGGLLQELSVLSQESNNYLGQIFPGYQLA